MSEPKDPPNLAQEMPPEQGLIGENGAPFVERRKRKRRASNKISGWLHSFGSAARLIMLVILCAIGLAFVVRLGLATSPGRSLIAGGLNNLPIGSIGHLNVRGLSGDPFDALYVEHASITDSQGVWIEGQDLVVRLDARALFTRTVKLTDARAALIVVHRDPVLAPKGPEHNIPVAVSFDHIAARVVTEPAFSIVPGDFNVVSKITISRHVQSDIRLNIVARSHPADHVAARISIGRGLQTLIDVRARAANGGAIAGALGVDAAKPFSFDLLVAPSEAIGQVRVFARSGDLVLANLSGQWSPSGGDISGPIDFTASKWTKGIGERFGQAALVDLNLGAMAANGNQRLNGSVKTEYALLNIDGPINLQNGLNFRGVPLSLNMLNVGAVSGQEWLNPAGAPAQAQLRGVLNGAPQNAQGGFSFAGNIEGQNIALGPYQFSRLKGPFSVRTGARTVSIETSATLTQNLANSRAGGAVNLLHQYLGQNAVLSGQIISDPSGWHIERARLVGAALSLNGQARRALLGDWVTVGTALIDAQKLGISSARGQFSADWRLVQTPQDWRLSTNGKGAAFQLGVDFLDAALGPNIEFNTGVRFNGQGAFLEQLEVRGKDVEIDGTSSGRGPLGLNGRYRIDPERLTKGLLRGIHQGRFNLAPTNGAALALNLDGAVSGWASKLSQIDALFGAAPTISGAIIFGARGPNIEPNDILLSALTVSGEAITGTHSGRIRLPNGAQSGSIALDLEWRALRPLEFGPLSLNGALAGGGHIVGPFSAPILTFNANFGALDLPFVSLAPANANLSLPLNGQGNDKGTLSITGNSPYGAVEAKSELTIASDTMALTNIDISGAGVGANGSANIGGDDAVTGALEIHLRQGLILSEGAANGRVVFAGQSGTTQINLTGSNFSLRGVPAHFSNASIIGGGNGAHQQFNINLAGRTEGANPQSLSYSGILDGQSNDNRRAFTLGGQGSLGGARFTIADPISLSNSANEGTLTGALALIDMRGQSSGHIKLDARRGRTLMGRNNLSINLDVDSAGLSILSADLSGSIDGRVRLTGTENDLRGEGLFTLHDALSRGLSRNLALNGQINGRLGDDNVRLDLDVTNQSGLAVTGDMVVPIIAAASPLRLALGMTAPVTGHLNASGEVRQIADLIFAGERVVSGPIQSHLDITGTLSHLIFNGHGELNGGELLEPSIGLRLRQLSVSADVVNNNIQLAEFSARDGNNGHIQGQGAVSGSNGQPLHLDLDHFRLFNTTLGEGTATGQLTFNPSHNGTHAKLAGQLQIDRADFRPLNQGRAGVVDLDVVHINRQTPAPSAGNNILAGAPENRRRTIAAVDFDIDLDAPRGIFVRGRGLNLEMSLDGHLGGSSTSPSLTGQANVYRGGYTYAGRVFDFEDDGLVLLGNDPDHIRLNLAAVRQADDLDARITITGTAAQPLVALTSVPALPEDEILSRVLFGRSTAQLNGIEALQLASGLASLTGGDSFDVIGNLRDLVSLDGLNFVYGTEGVSLSGGKYLGRDIYLELISEPAVGIISQIEWRPVRQLAITSRVAPDGDARVAVRWRRQLNSQRQNAAGNGQ